MAHQSTCREKVSRDIIGSNPVVPLSKTQIVEAMMRQRPVSPAKQTRVQGYMQSTGMIQSIGDYKDRGDTKGLVNVKPRFGESTAIKPYKKEDWHPKVSLKWYEPYRTPLTIQ